MQEQKQIIRVYGIYIDAAHNILVSDEKYGEYYFTKFPGGGLEWGEGTRACLAREFKEEFNIDITVQDHFYTTDFFQQSAWHTQQQIISIYYYIEPLISITAPISLETIVLAADQHQAQALRFVPLAQTTLNTLPLPIDKIVVEKLLQNHKQ
jgi:8-oxo-dGTP diphosphatase